MQQQLLQQQGHGGGGGGGGGGLGAQLNTTTQTVVAQQQQQQPSSSSLRHQTSLTLPAIVGNQFGRHSVGGAAFRSLLLGSGVTVVTQLAHDNPAIWE
jgi:hypothetical protein